jgi:hypothetical protein
MNATANPCHFGQRARQLDWCFCSRTKQNPQATEYMCNITPRPGCL